jgi:hypothetical protein
VDNIFLVERRVEVLLSRPTLKINLQHASAPPCDIGFGRLP